ncbi:T9SS type A sorting domain-containing protein, partial [candidate division WOR-3 bacterium]|nr:T9SS type A sorting domain-containing protein [candidate division WOR-3 bacterium]
LLMVNSSVIPLWPYQSTNLAHGHSYFLAVNSFFEYEPEAMDTALVMVAAIDSPATGTINTTIDIYGSAWIDAGPFNQISFDRYKLSWSYDGDTIWTLIHESFSQVHSDAIAAWNTSGMSENDYDIRLTVWDDAGDSLTAFGDITLQAQGVNENKDVGVSSSYLHIYPNPFTTSTTISFTLPNAKGIGHSTKNIGLKIYDSSGRLIKIFPLTTNHYTLTTAVSWDGKDDLGKTVASGVYFCKLEAEKGSQTEKILLLR